MTYTPEAGELDRPQVPWASQKTQVDTVDLRAPVLTLWAYRRLIILVAGSITALAVVIALSLPPQFKAIAQIAIDTRGQNYVDIEGVVGGLEIDDATIASEIGIITSNPVLERVVIGLRLDRDPDFNSDISVGEEALDQIRDWVGLPQPVAPTTGDGYDGQTVDRVVTKLRRSLTVAPVANSLIINVGATASTPRKAALIANAVANMYLASQLTAKEEEGVRAQTWFEGRLAEITEGIRDNELAVQEFQIKQLATYGESGTSTVARVAEVGQQLARAQTERASAESRYERLREASETGDLSALPEVVTSDLIGQLQESIISLQAEEANLMTRMGDLHPDVLSVRAQIAKREASLDLEIERIAGAIEKEFERAKDYQSGLEALLTTLEQRLLDQQIETIELRALEAELEISRAVYQSFLTRYREVSETTTLLTSDSRLVSDARPPLRSSGTSRKLVVGLASVFGLGVGVLLVLVLEALNQTIRSGAQVERLLFMHHLASLPLVRDRRWRTNPFAKVAGTEASVFAEKLRGLRTSLTMDGNGVRVLAVTSSLPAEGKSTTSALLARSFGEMGHKVLLVEGDLRRPSLSRWLTPRSTKPGLVQTLENSVPVSQAVSSTDYNFDFLSVGQRTPSSADILGGSELLGLFDILRDDYDFIIVDLPPVLPISDALLFQKAVDGYLFLTRWNSTTRTDVRTAMKKMKSSRAPILGVILTQVDTRRAPQEEAVGLRDSYYNPVA